MASDGSLNVLADSIKENEEQMLRNIDALADSMKEDALADEVGPGSNEDAPPDGCSNCKSRRRQARAILREIDRLKERLEASKKEQAAMINADDIEEARMRDDDAVESFDQWLVEFTSESRKAVGGR